MKTRDYYFAKAQALTDSGTVSVLIPPGLKLQHLRVILSGTNGATSNTVGKLSGMVTKIEVLNGSDILQSLSGRENQGYFFFNSSRVPSQCHMPYMDLRQGAGIVLKEEFPCLFGRYFLDPTFYLDTSRYQNCTLRITYALTISATAGFATGTGLMTVIGRVIDDGAPPYQGFVMVKELQSLTTAASGDDPTILPLDWPYFSLMVGALKTTIEPDAIFTNFKLLVNAGQYIPFDMTSIDVIAQNFQQFGEATHEYVPFGDTTNTTLCNIYKQTGAIFSIQGATGKGNISSCTAESIVAVSTTGQADNTNKIRVWGKCPHSQMYMPIGDDEDPNQLFQVQGINDLRLIKTQGTTGAAATVVSAQLRQ